MNIVRWSPFRELDHLMAALDRPSAPMRRADWLPLVDIRETYDDYQIDVELPAVSADDVSVDVSERVLTVSGERKSKTGEEQKTFSHKRERAYGHFQRSFQLPDDADTDAITATNTDGVLYLRIGKRVKASKRIDVKVG